MCKLVFLRQTYPEARLFNNELGAFLKKYEAKRLDKARFYKIAAPNEEKIKKETKRMSILKPERGSVEYKRASKQAEKIGLDLEKLI